MKIPNKKSFRIGDDNRLTYALQLLKSWIEMI